MYKIRRLTFCVAITILALLATSVLATVDQSNRETKSKEPLLSKDVFLVEGIKLESTASDEEQELIRTLVRLSASESKLAAVTIDYPMDTSVFPPDFIAPTFLWHDKADSADRWLVDVSLSGGKSHIYVLVPSMAPEPGEIDERCIAVTNELYQPTPYQASAKAWKPHEDLWKEIKRHSVTEPASITFYGYRNSDVQIVSKSRVTFNTSKDPVDAPIFYRDVPLMPSKGKDGIIKPLDQTALPLIEWRLKDISRPDSRVLLKDMPTCANCHSFPADGKTLAMDVDGPDGDKGAYAIAPIERHTVIQEKNVITWNAYEGRPEDRLTFGLFSRISPDGRYVISTVNDYLYVRNYTDYKFLQAFYPTRGIFVYYSRDTGEFKALPGADNPDYVHSNAVWTPDGKTIIFSRARSRNPYDAKRPVSTYSGDPNETQIQYDLYRIPFNDGRGGHPEPILGASNNGMSNSFPKVSPDGKWIVFVKSRNALLMRSDSKLWIVPVNGGKARMMQCNMPLMNSWHSFSPNGRWLVFSSKSNTPYTQMFLTHIDEAGNDSPALVIENATAANRAVNIPEFVNTSYDEFSSISVPAVDYYKYFQRGNELAKENRHQEALAELQKALKGEWKDWRINDWRIHDSLSKVLLQLGEIEQAEEHIHESLRLNPDNAEMHGNLGYIMFERGNLDQALKHMNVALQLSPKIPKVWNDRATLRLTLGNRSGAIEDYTKAIELDATYAEAYNGRGMALIAEGDSAGALADFSSAIQLDPNNPTPWYFRARINKEKGNLTDALNDATKALEVCPKDAPHQLEQIKKLRREVLEMLSQEQ